MIPGIVAGGMARGGGGGGSDPYWANVVALLHFDGADASTSFPDETGRAWTPTNSTQVSTAESMFGGASGRFGVATAGVLATASTADFNFGTGDFTIECWVNFHATGRGYIYSNNGNSAAIILSQSGAIEIYGPSSHLINFSGSAFSVGTWYHIALVRIGNVWTFYTDGTAVASNNDSRSWGTDSNEVRVGNNEPHAETYALKAYIDEFRVTKGVGRYTGAFTPAGPFPNS